jgi:hypothetical protein
MSAASKRVAIVQSSYIPWKGYFDLIAGADEFLLFDDRQFTKRDWRSRNRVKTTHGTTWLTVPVLVKGRYRQRIDEARTDGSAWREKHWRTIAQNYAAAPFFDRYAPTFEALYLDLDETRLSLVNRTFIDAICAELRIATRISWSSDYAGEGDRSERLLSLCVAAGANEYLSGPAAKAYLDERLFAEHGISITYMDYSGYPEYPQLHPPFEHEVTVLDLLFNTGTDAPRYMKSLRT